MHADALGEPYFLWVGHAGDRTRSGRVTYCNGNRGVGVTEQYGAVRTQVIDVLATVDVEDLAARSTGNHRRMRMHRQAGPNGRIHAAGKRAARPIELLRACGSCA